MDLSTRIGLLAAMGVIVAAILTRGDFGLFVNTPSLLIVIGGTTGGVLMKLPLGGFFGALKVVMKAFLHKSESAEQRSRAGLTG
jgi:chemotaxis protein MotA